MRVTTLEVGKFLATWKAYSVYIEAVIKLINVYKCVITLPRSFTPSNIRDLADWVGTVRPWTANLPIHSRITQLCLRTINLCCCFTKLVKSDGTKRLLQLRQIKHYCNLTNSTDHGVNNIPLSTNDFSFGHFITEIINLQCRSNILLFYFKPLSQ